MKKIIFALCSILVLTSSYGVTLCKKNNTAIAVLNKTVGGSVTSASGHAWAVAMTDGNNVRGKSLCTAQPGTGFAEVNTAVADTADTGTYCYCKMMGPATTYWVYIDEYADATACENGCVTMCADLVSGTYNGSAYLGACAASVTMSDVTTDTCLKYRNGLYESIW